MEKFIYCFDDSTKEKLLKNGYDFMKEVAFENKVASLFINNGNKLNFSNNEVVYSNKLKF